MEGNKRYTHALCVSFLYVFILLISPISEPANSECWNMLVVFFCRMRRWFSISSSALLSRSKLVQHPGLVRNVYRLCRDMNLRCPNRACARRRNSGSTWLKGIIATDCLPKRYTLIKGSEPYSPTYSARRTSKKAKISRIDLAIDVVRTSSNYLQIRW